ncbi:MAG: MotA/TolQ/ExbB proton channel family protein [Thermodesulfobacteriota bacterium]
MFENLSLFGLIQKGGVTVIVLGALSVISITIILERAWAFRRFGRELEAFFGLLDRTVRDKGLSVAASLSESHPSPLAPVFLSGYRKKGRGKDEVSGAMELAARGEMARLERFLGILGTIGSTAPFIGLFGTVVGIIRAFSDLALTQGASPAAVADGIAEALVATAAGLFVAVPAVMAYNYFVRTTSRHALKLETAATEFTDAISSAE